MSAITERLLFFIVIACCTQAHAQLACCQVQEPASSIAAGTTTISVAFSYNGNCLAAANEQSGNISIFSVGEDCTLTPVATPGTGILPTAVAFSPTLNCLAVTNRGSFTISMFTINEECNLAPVMGSPFGAGSNPFAVAFSPDGRCLAVTRLGDNTVATFSVDEEDCSLSGPISVLPTGTFPRSVAFSPNGNCLVVANQNSDNISLFSVGDDPMVPCGLTFLGNMDVGSAPQSVTFSPDGRCLAVTNFDDNNISVFSVDDLMPCSLTFLGNVDVGENSSPNSLAFSTLGNCVAVSRGNNTISLFTIDENCNFEPVGIPVSAGGAPRSVAFSPNSRCLAVANGTNPGAITIFNVAIAQQPIITSTTVINCNFVTVTGTSSANATITLFVDGVLNAVGATDGAGNFTIVTTPLSTGTHSITAVATVSGCTSVPSNAAIVTIGSPTITSASVGCGNFVTVVGTGVPNSMVSIAVDDVTIATVTTNSEGTFVFAGIQLSTGIHCITATDTAGDCTSAPVCIDVSPFSCVLGGPNLAFGTHCNR